MTGQSRRKRGDTPRSAFAQQVLAARRNRELINRLARWRAEHHLSQVEVAKRMQTSQPAVTRLESHKHDALLSTLARYAAALGLSVDFVLRDSSSGSQVWSSFEEPRREDAKHGIGIEKNEPGEVVALAHHEAPGLTIFDDTWDKLSGHDLEHQRYVVAAAEEPGWNLVYATSEGQPLPSTVVAPQAGHTKRGEDPSIVGVFGPEDVDPIAIATAPGSAPSHPRQVHTLVAKVRNLDLEDIEHQPEESPGVEPSEGVPIPYLGAAIEAIREVFEHHSVLVRYASSTIEEASASAKKT
jgi:transcriptional regulator with XRE-family HTH domain